MKLKIFRIVFAVLMLTSFVVSCDQSKEEAFVEEKPKTKLIDFGFNLHDFNVVNDTVKSGDTFGSLLQKQNLNGKQVYDIVAQVKDTCFES